MVEYSSWYFPPLIRNIVHFNNSRYIIIYDKYTKLHKKIPSNYPILFYNFKGFGYNVIQNSESMWAFFYDLLFYGDY